MTEQPLALVVLGMHRSGTSALTRVLSLLGAGLPKHLMGAVAGNNDTGFWESTAVQYVNDQLLTALESHWDDWRPAPMDSLSDAETARWQLDIHKTVKAEFGDNAIIALKDPRICRLVPLWHSSLVDHSLVEPRYIIPIRNPIEVAQSLHARNGLPVIAGVLLWLRHVLDAEHFTRNFPRCFTHYEALLRDWRSEISTIQLITDIRWPIAVDKASSDIEAFLCPNLRHQSAPSRLENALPPSLASLVKNTLTSIENLEAHRRDESAFAILDETREKLNELALTFAPLEQFRRQTQKERQQQLANTREKLQNRIARVQELESLAKDRNRKNTELLTEISELNRKLSNRVARVSELEDIAQLRKREISELRTKIQTLHDNFKNRSERVVQLETLAQQRKQQIAKLSDTLDSTTRRRDELEQLAQQRKSEIGELQKIQERLNEQLVQEASNRKQQAKDHKVALDRVIEERNSLQKHLNVATHAKSQAEKLKVLQHLRAERARNLVKALECLSSHPQIQPRWLRPLLSKKYNTSPLSAKKQVQLLKFARLLQKTNAFDSTWYQTTYPDVARSKSDPLWHWLITGWHEKRNPHALFDTAAYLQANPDVRESGLNPLLHFLEFGWKEGREPSALFNMSWYLKSNPDVASANINPWLHYIQFGEAENRPPNPYFRPRWYSEKFSIPSNQCAIAHYCSIGATLGYDPSPEFKTDWYLAQHPDVNRQNLNPLYHFLRFGQKEGRHANPHESRAPEKHHSSTFITPAPALKTIKGHKKHRDKHIRVLVCAHAANGELYGSERSFLDILELLDRSEFDVHVILPKENHAYVEATLPWTTEVAIAPYQYWTQASEPNPEIIQSIRAYCVSRRINLVHVNTIVIREPLLAARGLGLPTLTHARESIFKDRWMADMLGCDPEEVLKSVLKRTDLIIANSPHTAQEFHKPDRTHIVPNTFDMNRLDLENTLQPERIYVGLISSNIPKKGIEDFALLAAACAEEIPNLRFRLIGPDNTHVAQLKERQKTGGLPRTLEFSGYQKSPTDALRMVNIVLNLSHFAESFGRTVVEGLAARRPVVVYDLGAAKDLVDEGVTGHVVPMGNWQEIIPLLKRWAKNPDTLISMGETGRKFVLERYGREAGRTALTNAYNAALIKHPLPRDVHGRTDRIASSSRFEARLSTTGAKPRMAYFCWHFPVPSETFVLNELRALIRQGVDVRVYCRQTPHPDFHPDFSVIWTRVNSSAELAEQLKADKRDFVHAHFTYPTVTDMVWPACQSVNLPFTFIAHAQDIFKYENDRQNRINDITHSPLCKAVFVLGQFHRTYLIERGVPDKKIIINPNAIDLEHFSFAPSNSQNAKRRICAIHRLTEKKGLRYLVEAAELLNGENLEINIYGYGDEEQALRDLITSKQLKNIHLRGALLNAQSVETTLSQHDAFIAPSIRTENGDMDGIPTSVVEAMAVGIPVITTRTASIPDLVKDGLTGFLVEPKSAESLAEGIRRLYNTDPSILESIKKDARSAVTQRHDSRRLTRVLQRVWQDTAIDLVIVSWNNLLELKEVIRRVFTFTKTPFHLTICDNASNEDVVQYLVALQASRDNVTVVFREANTFVGPGTNRATDQGSAPYIVYICGKEGFVLKEGWETDFIEYMESHPEVGLAGTLGYSPKYLTGKDMPVGISQFNDFRNIEFAAKNPDRVFHHVQGGLFILRRQMYDEIGGFSESVPHDYTDVEYSYYAESRGWKLGTIPHMLALFNKTRPDIWARIDESIKIIHPPRLEDLDTLDKISNEVVCHCNLCNWIGDRFSEDKSCPSCRSSPTSRSLVQTLSGTILTHRRLPALLVSSDKALYPFWKTSFQGPILRPEEFAALLKKKNQLDNQTGALTVAFFDSWSPTQAGIDQLKEVRRLLGPNGTIFLTTTQPDLTKKTVNEIFSITPALTGHRSSVLGTQGVQLLSAKTHD